MKRMTIATLMLMGLALIAGGCGEESVNSPVVVTPALRTVPADNTVGYDPRSPIYMMFSDRMDTVDFHDYFFCVDSTAHRGLQDSLMWHVFGMMGMHQDSMMYYQRMHERGVRGQFHWNVRGDSCAFIPDSALMHGTRYYMHFRGSMKDDQGDCYQYMGVPLTEDLTYGFRTR